MYALGSLHHGAVQLEPEFNHGIGFIDILRREYLRRKRTKYLLYGDHDRPILLQPACNIQQAEHHPMRTDAKKIVQVPTTPLAKRCRRQFRPVENRGRCRLGIGYDGNSSIPAKQSHKNVGEGCNLTHKTTCGNWQAEANGLVADYPLGWQTSEP